ncbi:ATP-binding cassette domain-containing protein, partial [Escherichia coli]|nr:ATP-binding cassette domain-containing protein [Escherichia coli]
NRAQARERTAEMLRLVDIPPDRMKDYPHQFSGGMRQRIVIAICLALNPKIVVMDEPTTALDVVVQREILQRINELRRTFGFSVLFITHDLGLMVQFC